MLEICKDIPENSVSKGTAVAVTDAWKHFFALLQYAAKQGLSSIESFPEITSFDARWRPWQHEHYLIWEGQRSLQA
jgi:predicted TIM-barrel enzyme